MKIAALIAIALFTCFFGKTQTNFSFFSTDSLKKDVSLLASDSLKGRGNFTKELEQAADYIASNFQAAGLKFFPGNNSYFQPFFTLQREKGETFEDLYILKEKIKEKEYFLNTSFKHAPTLGLADFAIHEINPSSNLALFDSIASVSSNEKPSLFLIGSSNKSMLDLLKAKKDSLPVPKHTVLVVARDNVLSLVLQLKKKFRQAKLMNVIGMLPGKKFPNELVLVSAHYDHIGIGSMRRKDSINNGANDDASGVAAMMAMAKYFAAKNDNERTIVFVAFAGEELGLYGSEFLSRRIKSNSVIAVVNLEMLGKVHDKGEGQLMITGDEYGNMGTIMRKYCTSIKVVPDIYYFENMFRRSDNYHFAKLGIPAHTLMCFTVNDENYHQPSDEISTLDFENMSLLVKGLIPGIEAIVQKIETPKRIKL